MSIIVLALVLSVTAAHAQTWEELRAMRKETTVRIHEVGGNGWFADGKLLLVKDDELTILQGRRPLVIPKASIARVEKRHRDSPVQGAIIGGLLNIGLGLFGGWQGCPDSKCVAVGIPLYAGLGAVIDWQIVGRRTIYNAP